MANLTTIISASINLDKIDESKIVTGKQGRYYDFDIMLSDEPDQYGYHASIVIKQSKEQREAKEKRVYLGNGKVVWKK